MSWNKIQKNIDTCRICEWQCVSHLRVPAVKCPSERDGKDHTPAWAAIRNCSAHLRRELEFAQAERVLALGRVPMRAVTQALDISFPPKLCQARLRPQYALLKQTQIPVAVTYFPGNNRHRGFEKIVEDIRAILGL